MVLKLNEKKKVLKNCVEIVESIFMHTYIF